MGLFQAFIFLGCCFSCISWTRFYIGNDLYGQKIDSDSTKLQKFQRVDATEQTLIRAEDLN